MSNWHNELLDDLMELQGNMVNEKTPRKQTLSVIIDNLEEEWSKEKVELHDFTECPKCGDDKNREHNFCPRCGYETGYCKHDELGYEQDGETLFCLRCKKTQITKNMEGNA